MPRKNLFVCDVCDKAFAVRTIEESVPFVAVLDGTKGMGSVQEGAALLNIYLVDPACGTCCCPTCLLNYLNDFEDRPNDAVEYELKSDTPPVEG